MCVSVGQYINKAIYISIYICLCVCVCVYNVYLYVSNLCLKYFIHVARKPLLVGYVFICLSVCLCRDLSEWWEAMASGSIGISVSLGGPLLLVVG